MTVGFVMLVHEAFDRAEQVARHWSKAGCPVVIHVDKRVGADVYGTFKDSLSDLDGIRFSERQRCEWGTWSLVEASQTASEMMLAEFPEVRHVYLASGSCLPLRPVEELRLPRRAANDGFHRKRHDRGRDWTVGGLDNERFEYCASRSRGSAAFGFSMFTWSFSAASV
jgi:hypothetical protein